MGELRKIMSYMPEDRQTLLFSATFPKAIKEAANKYCYRDALHIQVGSTDGTTGNIDIEQIVNMVDSEYDKMGKLMELVRPHYDERAHDFLKNSAEGGKDFKMLVFCQTKRNCIKLSEQFYKKMK